MLVVLMSVSWQAFGDAPLLKGLICPWGSVDCNACIPDPVDSVNSLRSHGDILGFHMNGAPDVSLSHHWQGVQRLVSGNARYLAVSRNIDDLTDDVSFVVVKMGSRNDTGLRFRSNRLFPTTFFEATAPPASDGIVKTVPVLPGFKHAGGMQLSGNFLVVPFEDGPGSKAVFYDLSNPENPQELTNHVDHSSLSSEAGTASLIKLMSGHFLLIIGRKNANILDFYVSQGTDLTTTAFDLFDSWDEGELLTTIGDEEFGNYQNLNLLTRCNGDLYLIGTHKNSLTSQDFTDLYRVSNGVGDEVVITKVAKKHVICKYRGINHCNLDAAGGTYVDPGGRLYIYGVEHDNDGPGGSVKFEEFRPVPHGTCTNIRDAWVELYDDNTFRDRGLMIDFVDRELENYENYDHAEGFEDKASSVRWCIPSGGAYRLWQDKNPCEGSNLDLAGNGTLQKIANLDDVGFGDSASCSEWIGGPFSDAGADQEIECNLPDGNAIALNGLDSITLDGALDYHWEAPGVIFDDPSSPTPAGQFPHGDTVVTLTVSNSEASDSDTLRVSVIDTKAPLITCPADITVDPVSPAGTVVNFEAASWSDACDINLPVPTCELSGTTFPIGTETEVGCSVTDTTASLSSSCSLTVKVLSEVEVVEGLQETVNALADQLSTGQENALKKHLRDILKLLAKDKTNATCDKLANWVKQIQTWEAIGAITSEAATALLEPAINLSATLACRA